MVTHPEGKTLSIFITEKDNKTNCIISISKVNVSAMTNSYMGFLLLHPRALQSDYDFRWCDQLHLL